MTALLVLGQAAEAHLVLERFRAQGFLAMLAERDIVLSGIPPDLEAKRRDLAVQYDASIRERDKLYAGEQLLDVLERQREIRRERERLGAEIRRRALALLRSNIRSRSPSKRSARCSSPGR